MTTVTSDNLTTDDKNLPFSNSVISNNENSVWIIVLQKSQLVMTIVGLIANLGTSTTLIKNGQVGARFIGATCFISQRKTHR